MAAARTSAHTRTPSPFDVSPAEMSSSPRSPSPEGTPLRNTGTPLYLSSCSAPTNVPVAQIRRRLEAVALLVLLLLLPGGTVPNMQVSFSLPAHCLRPCLRPTDMSSSTGSAGPRDQQAGHTVSDRDPHRPTSASTTESPPSTSASTRAPPSPGIPDRQDAVAGLLAISGCRINRTRDRTGGSSPDRDRAGGSSPDRDRVGGSSPDRDRAGGSSPDRASTTAPGSARSSSFRSSYIRSDRRRVPLANANVGPPPLDASTLRSSLAAIEVALEREGAFQQLRLDYANLQGQLRSAEDHIQSLEHQFSEAARLASPFVQYCQHRYDLIRQDLNDSRRQFGEVVNALAGHEGDRVRIANLESQLQDARQQHAVVIDGLNQTISSLTDQLAAALLQTPTASYQDLQRMRAELNSSIAIRADLQQALNQAIAARDQLQTQLVAEIDAHTQTRQELADSQDSNSALSSSQDALEAAADQLRRQLASVQQNLAHVRLSADANFNLAISERDQACDERDRAILDLQDRDTQLRRARSDRDQARGEMRTYRKFFISFIRCS
ncbi:hypothetical protein DVH05_002482 [Phytophthora capsici]|nr:hypothetical protein DVH05_002482 [Phytophthora capsici]